VNFLPPSKKELSKRRASMSESLKRYQVKRKVSLDILKVDFHLAKDELDSSGDEVGKTTTAL